MREYFSNPNMLWALLILPPALLLFFWWSWRKRRSLLTLFIQARLLPSLTVGMSPARQKIRLACIVLAVACLLLALARPRWGFDWEDVKLRGLDIVVAIDTSKSMTAEDIAPNRLARAKLAALDLMHMAKADRLGLVAFAGGAFLQCPLTIDDAAFRQSVDSLDVNIIPQGGTALAEAIEVAMTAFKEGDNYKILVLMTDGEDHDSGAVKAAEQAAKEGLHIYTIGIGTPEGEVLRIKDAQGKTDYIRDEQGNVVKSHLNEDLLQKIAAATEGGFYLPLRGAKTMETLYQDGLARLPKSQHQEKMIKQYHERYHWPLAVGILLLLFEMVFPERKSERKSQATPAKRPAAQPVAVIVLLFTLATASIGRASPASALKEYEKGNYAQALQEYEKLLQRQKDDPRLHFNAGAAAYRSRDFNEATKQFDEAIATPDLQLQQRAYFNRGNSLFHLGETTADPKEKTDQWERSLKDFEIASKLNQKDADAQFNREYVKRKLEELKQQQQQQQQKNDKNDKDDKQNQDQKNQQDQKGDQSKNDDQKQQQQNKQDQSKQDQAKQNQDGKQDKSEQQKKEDQQKQASKQKQDQQKKEQEKQEQAANGQDQKDNSDEQQQEAQAAASGQMTPQQAKQLLDAQKGDEQLMPVKPTAKPADTSRAMKDW